MPAGTVCSPASLAHHHHHLIHSQQQKQLHAFWANQLREINQTTDFKNHTLPLARIKKIMKADEDVRMISAKAPVIFAKACEIFVLELTLRSWINTEENKRRTLQKNDIAAAISRTDVFDFLVDIIPRDELKEEGLGVTKSAGVLFVGFGDEAPPYYYAPSQHHPIDEQHRATLPFVTWQPQEAPPQQQPRLVIEMEN
ncbi:hypothetical protein ABFX02_13G144400 [Erythranthe guttata]